MEPLGVLTHIYISFISHQHLKFKSQMMMLVLECGFDALQASITAQMCWTLFHSVLAFELKECETQCLNVFYVFVLRSISNYYV